LKRSASPPHATKKDVSEKHVARSRPASAGPTASVASAAAKITPARAAAFHILTLIGENKGHSDELLHSPTVVALTPEDRNLVTALVMGTLRWQIALDARLAKLLARPGQRLAEPVALALRLGAFQLLHLDRIPAHAVLNESVELCRAAGHPHAAGMVNAILRKLAAAQRPGTRVFESAAAFAERLAHPAWLVERWVAHYGRESALAICEYDQREPHSGSLFASPPEPEAAPTATHPTHALPQMDDGSRLAAPLPSVFGRIARVWDCCAAPGGKTLILAHRLPGAEILASDISSRRLTQTTARLRRYAYAEHVRCEIADAAADTSSGPGFDLILCDVPCTGTGTLARNPEIRLRLRPEDLARQTTRQRAILAGALRRLAPGGRLVYSTCSLEPEENEQVLAPLLADSRLSRVPVQPLLATLTQRGVLAPEASSALAGATTAEGTLRTLPGVHPCDGFFAAVLERNYSGQPVFKSLILSIHAGFRNATYDSGMIPFASWRI
jgi:16S rRNA (cytosine967-C5)-methyltransferase